MIMRFALMLPAVLTLAACGDAADDPAPTGAPTGSGGGSSSVSGAGGGGGVFVPPVDSFSLTFGPVSVASGEERTRCIVKRLGNPELLHVGKIHNALVGGSHHLVVYRTNDAEEQLEPFECTPFRDTLDPSKGSPLMITQKHDETLTLPPGVAFTLQPNQMIRLEMHYLNTTGEAAEVSSTSTFLPIGEGEFQNEAEFLFIGNPDIKIPASSTHTLGPTYFALPQKLAGSQFFGITGHTHQYGTNVGVASTTGKAGTDTPIYDVQDWLWNEPETVYHDPPFTVPDGGGFRFSCSWNNTSAQSVSFGESANQEMCFFWAYYYPSQGALVCFHSDATLAIDVCCPGNPLCSQLF